MTVRDVPMSREPCPRCSYHPDAISQVAGDDGWPTEGAVDICLGCGLIRVFTGYLFDVRDATADELQSILTDRSIVEVLRGRIEIKGEYKP